MRMTTDNIGYGGMAAAAERYKKWWVGKKCRLMGYTSMKFKLVESVELIGNPSFVYGVATLNFADGTNQTITTFSYVPRKYDVEVEDDR